jgi:hypothetical protein
MQHAEIARGRGDMGKAHSDERGGQNAKRFATGVAEANLRTGRDVT